MRILRQVALAFGSVLFCSGFALGQAKLGPHVVDSNGQRIGYFAGVDLSTGVNEAVVSINGEPYLMKLARNGFLGNDVLLYNEDAACHGQQFLAFNPNTDLLPPASFTNDGIYHYVDPTDSGPSFMLGVQDLHGDDTLGPCGPVGQTVSVGPHLIVQAPTLTPPFLVVDVFAVSPAPATATFNDVPTTHPFFQFIEALHASGITGGCSAAPPLYCPDNPVTRGQVAVFLAKALGL